MYSLLNELLSDKKGNITFTCFGIWHWTYIFAVLAILVIAVLYLKNQSPEKKDKGIGRFINIAFGLYVADFFLMPFAYQEIDIEKLPFHICTAMCVLCFLSRHNRFLKKYRVNFALLGFISNLVYLIYPAGVMWYQVHPLSYRVVQTLLFHGLMAVYGLLVLVFDEQPLDWKRSYRDLVIIVCITLWAILGNTLYNGKAGNYAHHFNWFFVTQDPFYILPQKIAPYIMPPLNIAVFFAAELLVYAVHSGIKKISINRHN